MLAQWPPSLFSKLPERTVADILSALHHSYGERSLKDIIKEIASGEMQVWVHSNNEKFNATIVTKIIDFPDKRTCEINYLGGDTILDCLDEITDIEEWAEHNGCDDIQVIGRRGWARALKIHGYDERYVVIGKQLTSTGTKSGAQS